MDRQGSLSCWALRKCFINLSQVIDGPNSNGVFLDLCFSNIQNLDLLRAEDLLLPESDHHVIMLHTAVS